MYSKVIHLHINMHILFHYDLLQDTEYSYLCYIAGPCVFYIEHVVVCPC